MTRSEQPGNKTSNVDFWVTLAAFALAILFIILATEVSHGQTFSVVHNLVGNQGTRPGSGVIIDAAGNLYGTTQYGGDLSCNLGSPGGGGGPAGCGVVFKLKPSHGSWILSVLYDFTSYLPYPGELTISPNGTLYGAQLLAGDEDGGAIFNLRPPFSAPHSVMPQWSFAQLHSFGSGYDGAYPGKVIFDASGNIFGTTTYGGDYNDGTVYEMTYAGGGNWNEQVLYSFQGGSDGYHPRGLAFDAQGNLYGTTAYGGNSDCFLNDGCGTVYKLTRSGETWTKTTLHIFDQDTEGGEAGPLTRDSAGNLFGLTGENASSNGGTVWEMSPSGGGWTFQVLYTFPYQTVDDAGPFRPVMDGAGALYAVTNWGGANNLGTVFKLTPSNGGWVYTNLHDFGSMANQADGCLPRGPLTLDASGNIFGTAEECAQYNGGDVFEITP